MKQHILPLLLMLTGMAAFSGCSTDELPGTEPTDGNDAPIASFSITVTDNGYASTDAAPHTRATENDYTTTFTAGDQIGVFAVKNNEIVNGINNLCLTAKDNGNGTLAWQDSNGNAPATILGDATYYAYYPYRSGQAGDVSASDVAGFFANVISNWTLDANQSTYAKYTAQDLMVAKGTLNGKSLSFSMTHQMALVVIELPRAKYVFTNTDPQLSDYIIDAPGTQFTDFTPCRMSAGTYRYFVNPGANGNLSGSYTDSGTKTWSFSPSSVSAGNYKVFQVDGAKVIKIEHNLQAGDFYMSDGSLVGKDVTLSDAQKQACLGIVMKVGKDDSGKWKDDCDYKQKDGQTPMTTIHGYVLALHDANNGNDCSWGPYTEVRTNREKTTGFYGYKNTQIIINYDNGHGKNLQRNFPATYYTTTGYDNNYSAPANSSGWFFPSAGQCEYWLKNKDVTLLPQMKKATGNESYGWKGWYWSSSERDFEPHNFAWYADFIRGDMNEFSKKTGYHVRSCLAF